MSGLPTRPGDVPTRMPLAEVAERYSEHVGRLVYQRYGVGDPVPVGILARHAVAALAYQHALAERAVHGRWVNVAEALTHGVSIEQVAQATDLNEDALRAGLARWADGQVRCGALTLAERDEVLALVEGVNR